MRVHPRCTKYRDDASLRLSAEVGDHAIRPYRPCVGRRPAPPSASKPGVLPRRRHLPCVRLHSAAEQPKPVTESRAPRATVTLPPSVEGAKVLLVDDDF